jgi:adenylyl-sulfate kinase
MVDHGAVVVWFTGLSGAGKSTIAALVAERMTARGELVELLDGNVIRGLLPNAGFSVEERAAHVRRVGFLASRLAHHGVSVIAALISPSSVSRAFVRNLCHGFVEVHVSTPIGVCERCDVKGLYARARRGELRDFTGVDAQYETPSKPEVTVDTTHMSVEDAVALVMDGIARQRAATRSGVSAQDGRRR